LDLSADLQIIVLAGLGVFAGALNTVAGGASLVTVPVMILLGLPVDVANASNRVAIATQSATGIVGFARARAIDRRAVPAVVVTSAIGAFLGAVGVTHVPRALLEPILLGVMVLMAAILVVRPTLVVAPSSSTPRWADRRAAALAALFATGLYGGFIQGGVGFLLVGVLSGVLGYPVGQANGLKAVATFVFGSVSLAVFMVSGLVAWGPALVLATSTTLGAMIGVRLALRAQPALIRWLLFAGVLGTSIAALLR
jgi:uncharacterized membrane protein YfcA